MLVNERRDEIGPKTQVVLQSTLDAYKSGISVTSINLEKLDYPRAVQDAVDDTQKQEMTAIDSYWRLRSMLKILFLEPEVQLRGFFKMLKPTETG